MMVTTQFIPRCIVLLLVISNTAHSYRLWHLNELANGLKNAGYHSLDLRPPFNSWGGKTSGITIFVSAPGLATPQGYFVPGQQENIQMNWNMKRAPFTVRSTKRSPYSAWVGK